MGADAGRMSGPEAGLGSEITGAGSLDGWFWLFQGAISEEGMLRGNWRRLGSRFRNGERQDRDRRLSCIFQIDRSDQRGLKITGNGEP